MAQKDVPGTKSHENGGPFRPSFSSQGHPSASPVCATSFVDIRLGLPSRGHPSRGHPSRGHPSRAPPSRGQPTSEIKRINFHQHSHGTSTNYYTLIKYSKTAVTTKTCQTNLKTIIIPNTLINAHTPYACIIIKYIKRQSMAFSRSSLPHTNTNTQADTPDPNYINATPQSLTRHSVADSSVATTSRPPDHKN